MKTSLLSVLSVPVALTLAAQPFKLGNGVWSIQYAKDGSMIGEPQLIAPVNTTAPVRRRGFNRVARQAPPLPNPSVQCSTDYINVGDFSCAQATLDNWADQAIFIGPDRSVTAVCNSAQAYMCAYSQSSRGWRSEIDEAYSDVNAVCGDNKSGWVYISAYDKSYGRDNAGLPECGF